MITICATISAPHQRHHQHALAAGLKTYGISTRLSTNPLENHATKYVACWGWRVGKSLRERGHEVLVMERGYVGNRFQHTSLGWNGLNGHATFPHYPYDEKRFYDHGGFIKPWKRKGDYILILGQVPRDASLQGMDMMPWYEEKALLASNHYGLPVHFRPHPDLAKRGIRQKVAGTQLSQGTLQEALDGAYFTICFNSNSSVDSLMHGVPCVVGDRGSMVYDMCSTDLHNLNYGSRDDLHTLAWKQWTLQEIETGFALKGIVCGLL